MDWLIYIILAFIYWKDLKFLSFSYIVVISASICWYAISEAVDRQMSVGGENYDI